MKATASHSHIVLSAPKGLQSALRKQAESLRVSPDALACAVIELTADDLLDDLGGNLPAVRSAVASLPARGAPSCASLTLSLPTKTGAILTHGAKLLGATAEDVAQAVLRLALAPVMDAHRESGEALNKALSGLRGPVWAN